MLYTIAVMDVPIDDEDAMAAELLLCVPRRDRRRVEDAKAHRLVRLRVVAGWADEGHPILGAAGHDRVGEVEHRAGGARGRVERLVVQVDGLVLRDERVDRANLLRGRPTRSGPSAAPRARATSCLVTSRPGTPRTQCAARPPSRSALFTSTTRSGRSGWSVCGWRWAQAASSKSSSVCGSDLEWSHGRIASSTASPRAER